MCSPPTRIRRRRNWETYDLFGEGVKMRSVRDEDEEIVGSLEYCFSGGRRPIVGGQGGRVGENGGGG